MLVVGTISCGLFDGLVILRNARRRVVPIGVTISASAEWIANSVALSE
jgi:hypothetical protein